MNKKIIIIILIKLKQVYCKLQTVNKVYTNQTLYSIKDNKALTSLQFQSLCEKTYNLEF